MVKYVYEFTEGDKDQKDLLGGKGANLAEMTRLGLPVPPGFTITTEACREYLRHGTEPGELRVQVTMALRRLEDTLGRQLGDRHDPLLVSVRSGAKFSMPGMMETVLNIGLNDASVKGLAEVSGDERFAWDSYRRLLQMFGKTVLDIDGEVFAGALDAAKAAKGVDHRPRPGRRRPARRWSTTFKAAIVEHSGREFPQHPREQLDLAIRAVFDSWNTDRARLYRRRERIPQDLGTAVNVCTMVFGNLGDTSGTGVAFTRDPASGKTGAYGDYLANAQGEDVVAGIRNTLSPGRPGEAGPGRRTSSCGRSCAGWRRTTATCATSSSPSSAASCGCCRRGSASAPPAAAFRIAVAAGRRAADHPGRGAGPGRPARSWPS